MKKIIFLVLGVAVITAFASEKNPFANKPTPDQAMQMLLDGNKRFSENKSRHQHSDAARFALAADKDQGDYAYATILGCSDSRAPIELIFDAGVMDIFVVRVPGNVCQIDEIGGAEYGIHHVKTPVMLVMGHSDCGAVTTTVAAETGKLSHKLERNIPPLLRPIAPVVRRAMLDKPELSGKNLIEYCIEENVYTVIYHLFLRSAKTREVVRNGKVKVAGAVYDIRSGKVRMLDSGRIDRLLRAADKDCNRENHPFGD